MPAVPTEIDWDDETQNPFAGRFSSTPPGLSSISILKSLAAGLFVLALGPACSPGTAQLLAAPEIEMVRDALKPVDPVKFDVPIFAHYQWGDERIELLEMDGRCVMKGRRSCKTCGSGHLQLEAWLTERGFMILYEPTSDEVPRVLLWAFSPGHQGLEAPRVYYRCSRWGSEGVVPDRKRPVVRDIGPHDAFPSDDRTCNQGAPVLERWRPVGTQLVTALATDCASVPPTGKP